MSVLVEVYGNMGTIVSDFLKLRKRNRLSDVRFVYRVRIVNGPRTEEQCNSVASKAFWHLLVEGSEAGRTARAPTATVWPLPVAA